MPFTLRQLENRDLPSLARLPPAALATLTSKPGATWANLLHTPSGTSVHRLGAWDGSALLGIAQVLTSSVPRLRHVGRLTIVGERLEVRCALARNAVDMVDDWLGLDRLEASIAADENDQHEALLQAGFVVEVTQPGFIARLGGFVDKLLMARLRPGVTLRAPRPLANLPRLARTPQPPTHFRLSTDADAEAVAAIMRSPEVLPCTMQVPWVATDVWVTRLQAVQGTSWVATVAGEVVAHTGLHPGQSPSTHVGEFGMAVRGDFHGRGIGRRLLTRLISEARSLGLARLALEVYADNVPAQRLYESLGFERNGLRRAQAIRTGGFADSIAMSMALR